jgi:hypothetical protein
MARRPPFGGVGEDLGPAARFRERRSVGLQPSPLTVLSHPHHVIGERQLVEHGP